MKKNTNLAFAATTLLSAGLAHSASLVGLFDAGIPGGSVYTLGRFDSANPLVSTNVPVTGLVANETLIGLDYRPATGQLYTVGTSQNVYTINPSTGLATSVGMFSTPLDGSTFGFDFNPAFMGGDFARIISDLNDNRVISGVDGSYLEPIEKTDVFYATGDPNEGVDPNIAHIGYTNSILGASATQQYGIDTSLDILVTVANNAGTLVTIGSLGIDAGEIGGFDIDGESGVAYLGFNAGISSELYTVDLTTGSATLVSGNLQPGMIGLTAVPEPTSAALLGLAGLGLGLRRRRK